MNVDLGESASQNPDLPVTLYNETGVSEWYGVVSDYYYITETASPALYHVIWVQPTDIPADNFDVWLYADEEYTDLEVMSIVGDYDWVVTRPSTYRPLFPTVHTYSTSGNAVIEWEDSSYHLNASADVVEGNINLTERIEVYGLSVSTTSKYTITLNASAGVDLFFDLYYMSPGDATIGSDYVMERDQTGIGGDEVLKNWIPTMSGEWALVVARGSGAGNFTLTISGQSFSNGGSPIPMNILPLLFGILVAILFKKSKMSFNPSIGLFS